MNDHALALWGFVAVLAIVFGGMIFNFSLFVYQGVLHLRIKLEKWQVRRMLARDGISNEQVAEVLLNKDAFEWVYEDKLYIVYKPEAIKMVIQRIDPSFMLTKEGKDDEKHDQEAEKQEIAEQAKKE